MNQQIRDAYKYHRQINPLLKAKRALEYARDDEKNDKRRYPSSTYYASVVNPPWKLGSASLRWIEKPESFGLRFVGFSDELVRSIDHKGWYTNEFQDETLRGVVYQWPARKGVERFVYGYADPDNECAAALCFDATDDKDDAARWADSVAEYAAEEEREYSAASNAKFHYDELGVEVSDTRKSLLQLIRELKEKRRSLCDAPSIIATLQASIKRGLDDIREAREKREKLENDFSYHVGWSQQ